MSNIQYRVTKQGKAKAGDFHVNKFNPKTHDTIQLDIIGELLGGLGVVDGLVAYKSKRNNNEWTLFNGHGRREFDADVEYPVNYTDLTDEEVDEYAWAFDRVAALATPDIAIEEELLKKIDLGNQPALLGLARDVITEDDLQGIDLAKLGGFGDEDFDGDFDGDGDGDFEDEGPQLDRADEIQMDWQVREGDIWQLGEGDNAHLVICGDCTKDSDVKALMGNDIAEILFTSPPYSDARDYGGQDMSVSRLKVFLSTFKPYAKFQCVNLGILFRDSTVLRYWDEYIEYAKEFGLKLLAWNIWDKEQVGSIASATAMFMLTHEFVFVFGVEKKRLNRTIENNMDAYRKRHGESFLSGTSKSVRQRDGSMETTTSDAYTHHQLHSVIRMKPELSRKHTDKHPAVMRIDIPLQYIEAMTNECDIVAEPFLGSGTTLMACQQTGRVCRGVEIEPKYVAVTLERFKEATGIRPTLLKNIHQNS